jgi:hypothetical protein
MKTPGILTLLAALALSVTPRACAGLYSIAFNDGRGDVGSGQIDVESANNNYYAVSGSLDVTAGQALGVWTLYTARGTTPYPGYIYSPSGAFIYNNAVYPDGKNPEYPGVNSLLDYYGLLFTQANGNELNLWGNADGSYTLGGNIGGWQNFNVNITFEAGGGGEGVTISPVPEPPTIISGVLLLVPVAASAFRFVRRNKLRR